MKIVVKKDNPELDKKFYDEFLFIGAFYKRILKNPKKKVRTITKNYTFGALLCLSYILIIVGICMLSTFSTLDYFIIGMMAVLAIIFLSNLRVVKKRLQDYLNNHIDATLEINDKSIILEKHKSQKLMLEWDSINMILINKYSIAFIPKDITFVMIGISTQYKEEILEAIKKEKKDSLLVDNSNLYK